MTTVAPAAVENTYAQYLAELARKQNTTPEEFRAPARVYWHRHNYAKFHFDLAPWKLGVKSIAFANFRYITDDKREQDQRSSNAAPIRGHMHGGILSQRGEIVSLVVQRDAGHRAE